jgi:hypothetical protein
VQACLKDVQLRIDTLLSDEHVKELQGTTLALVDSNEHETSIDIVYRTGSHLRQGRDVLICIRGRSISVQGARCERKSGRFSGLGWPVVYGGQEGWLPVLPIG